ncbi:nucleotidyltransferase domain-containing protein [Thauera mechernichensis]
MSGVGVLDTSLIAAVLAEPGRVAGLDAAAWSVLIGQARNAEMLGQLHARLSCAAALHFAPQAARRHLDLAWQLSMRHREAVRWEVLHIARALRKLDVPVVLLKGAAYALADYPAAEGRVFNDVDIMVPHAAITTVEYALLDAGWIPQIVNDYDQRYYRRWMHEIPPLEHKSRGTVLDVHHTIVPPTSGVVPDANVLLERAQPLNGLESDRLGMFRVLAPEDMVLHSAAHLFFNEFHKGLRDLYDLHRLLTHFGDVPAFWTVLRRRAFETGLEQPLNDALQHCARVFHTAVPEVELAQVVRARSWRGVGALRDWMLRRALLPDHPSCATSSVRFARWMAFVRSHWLRMPPGLLAVHLLNKAFRSEA